MKQKTSFPILLLFIALCLLLTTDAHAIGKKKIRIKNLGPAAVLVVMDQDREVKVIYPGKEDTFHEAKIGNRPTFKIFMDDKEVHSRDLGKLMNPFGTKKLIWNGQELVDE